MKRYVLLISLIIVLLLSACSSVSFTNLRVPLDENSSLVVQKRSPRFGETIRYVALIDRNERILWKTELGKAKHDFMPSGEKRFRRDVMLSDSFITYYDIPTETFFKLDRASGDILNSLVLIPDDNALAHWQALHDEENIYLINQGEDGKAKLSSISLADMAINWEIPVETEDDIDFWEIPLQNKRWLILHKDHTNIRKTIMAIDKSTGLYTDFTCSGYGFLKDDYYYAVEERNGEFHLLRKDLKTHEESLLYTLEGFHKQMPSDFLYSSYPSLWNYEESLLYLSETGESGNQRQVLRKLNISSGQIEWELSLPESYGLFKSINPKILSGAPEYSPFPIIRSRHLVLKLANLSSGKDKHALIRYLSVNLDNGFVTWQSDEQMQSYGTLDYTGSEGDIYKKGYYLFFSPEPDNPDSHNHYVFTIDGHSGMPGTMYTVAVSTTSSSGEEGVYQLPGYELMNTILRSVTSCDYEMENGTRFDFSKGMVSGKESGSYSLIPVK